MLNVMGDDRFTELKDAAAKSERGYGGVCAAEKKFLFMSFLFVVLRAVQTQLQLITARAFTDTRNPSLQEIASVDYTDLPSRPIASASIRNPCSEYHLRAIPFHC